ncbi:MAG: ATPase, partial [Proteobacteria bacterium]|nr:ATPase [Pseudomonadota bacterium]
GLLAIVWEVVREPMLLMLLAAGALYLSMGQPRDAALLLGFVFVVIGITVFQERRTEHALEALRDLSSPRALVIREGRARRIPGREVVPGDWVLVAEGDRVPADALLRRSAHLAVDESLLTGESVAVRKAPSREAHALEPPGGDGLASLYSGTLVVAGQGLAEVLATGAATQLGRIGTRLAELTPERTPLQVETGRVVRALALVGLGACALVVVAYALRHGAAASGWRDGLLAGLTMAMAILPEEFPVVLTVFLALGAWRISRSRVLTRRLAAIESLGAATVLCVDKTGTLTENRMAVARLIAGHERLLAGGAVTPIPEAFRTLLEAARLASRPQAFDPMERALHAAHAQLAPRPAEPLALVREYPLSAELLAMSLAWAAPGAATCRVAAKGAPEAILALCRLEPAAHAALEREVAAMAAEGLRVLAVASAECPRE